ncbi:trp operon repressor [Shewanella youngdeokensis]|uniref:Trp operon repressor n=1 Tax=Shewanella youngdeokensis TaxID=2999068 RepID=A0ABZ0JXV6_9GAMM|nr:trp operon repressor [Shewanella sp. DAU334]
MRAQWDIVLDKVMAQSDHSALVTLFELLLTEEERSAVASRFKIFQTLLHEQMSQRQIAQEYQISIATITRCSNYLKHMTEEQRELIKQLTL